MRQAGVVALMVNDVNTASVRGLTPIGISCAKTCVRWSRQELLDENCLPNDTSMLRSQGQREL